MTLTVREMEQITLESSLGLPPTLNSAAAVEFRAKIEKEVREIHGRGGSVEIPGEWDIEPIPPALRYKF